jgi:hypothetical protein
VLRFAIGVPFAFVLCEALNWRPTAMAPVLAGVLARQPAGASAPEAVPRHRGSMAVASTVVWLVSVLLRDTPEALWLAVGILFFATFLAMLRGAPACRAC